MNWKNLTIGAVVLAGLAVPVQALAAPRLTLSPTTQTVSNGSQFDVIIGVDSGTEKVIGIDIVSTFDASKLEIVSVSKGNVPDGGYSFTYTSSSPIIKNDTGRLEVTLPSANSSVYEGVVANHELLKVTFKAKAVGTAAVNYVCTAGSVTDSNIINQAGSDVVDCGSNSSGSYTITESSSSSPTSTPTLTPTPTTVGATPTTTLPDAGIVETTVGLLVFGLSTVAMALWFARL
jgi:hypothetical protein